MKDRRIALSSAVLDGNELTYVTECITTTAISGHGRFVEAFEAALAQWCGTRHVVSCSSGTAALHLALMGAGIGPGDEAIVPTLTYVATANAVSYCGGRPVFVDSRPDTWNIDPDLIEAAIGPRTKAIVPVHLFGLPADMDEINAIARRHGLAVIEDACQAHGAVCHGRRAGALGDAAAFSFFGSKTLTTGEGGAVTTNDAELARRMRKLRGQGMDPRRRYWFDEIGYNYRMTNVTAAIGLAQAERADWLVARRREVAAWYRALLGDVPGVAMQVESRGLEHGHWAVSVLLDPPAKRDAAIAHLAERGIETRPLFYPMHTLPPYTADSAGRSFPVADRLSRSGLTLPTWAGLVHDDVEYVAAALTDYVEACRRRSGRGARR